MLEYDVGNFSEGKVYLDRLLEVMRLTEPGPVYEHAFPAMTVPMAARISGESVLSSQSATPMVAAMTKRGLAVLAELKGDVYAARELYEGMERRQIVGTLGMEVDRLMGLLALTAGHVRKALEHFKDALAFCRKAGYRPKLAWTCYDYAGALLGGSEDGDSAKAVSLLSESLAISSDLGMGPLMSRVIALQERAASQPVRTPSYPNGLTQREVEVLLLITRGKTTRAIAVQFSLSPRTVQRHISNLYAKINVRNRVETTAFAQSEPAITPQPSSPQETLGA